MTTLVLEPTSNDDAELSAPAVLRPASGLRAVEVSAWFGNHQVLDTISLDMPARTVTSLIGPSGCGKSTFLRILNRMHELVPGATLAGEVLLGTHTGAGLSEVDVYDADQRRTDTRRRIGMVFQKPNPFPAMTIADNVLAGLRLSGLPGRSKPERAALVEECLTRAGLWNEVKNRLGDPGGSLSGGQQQRLCIARSLAVRPEVLLMDEPCSALDPTSTRRIEETILDLAAEVTVVIVTHNMQQAQRVSSQCAFFLAAEDQPGRIVEAGTTDQIFGSPVDPRTGDYVGGRFG
ncbi:MAG: phosphate transport system ATP-binding protein [Frankiales bacterium]|jgi:phosphate transport system ATP-binding protein|nr:phosphate transport system ATP-binding protein [Frankiales bacterium]